jgi:FKBP-type peptidyl-prolyl cis-trans isomerase (trigger factor)
MAKWMHDLVIGHQSGEILEGVSTPDADASQQDKEELKDKKVRVEINAVQTGEWPALDDAFAEKVGAKTVEELKVNVKNLLEQYGEEMVEDSRQQQVADWLINNYSFDLPHQMVVSELNQRLREFSQQEEFVTYYQSLSEQEKQQMIDSMLESSKNALRLALLTRQLLAQAKLKVDPSEIKEKQVSMLDLLMRPLHQQNQGMLEASSPNQQYSKLLLKKAAAYVMDHASKGE